MTVEYLDNGTWVIMENTSAQHIESNRYQVTIIGLEPWIRMTALDGAPLKIDGKLAFRVWGTSRIADRLVLDVLVQ